MKRTNVFFKGFLRSREIFEVFATSMKFILNSKYAQLFFSVERLDHMIYLIDSSDLKGKKTSS